MSSSPSPLSPHTCGLRPNPELSDRNPGLLPTLWPWSKSAFLALSSHWKGWPISQAQWDCYADHGKDWNSRKAQATEAKDWPPFPQPVPKDRGRHSKSSRQPYKYISKDTLSLTVHWSCIFSTQWSLLPSRALTPSRSRSSTHLGQIAITHPAQWNPKWMKRNGMGKHIPFILVLDQFGLISGNSTQGWIFQVTWKWSFTFFEPSFFFAIGTVMSYLSLPDMSTQETEDISRLIVK